MYMNAHVDLLMLVARKVSKSGGLLLLPFCLYSQSTPPPHCKARSIALLLYLSVRTSTSAALLIYLPPGLLGQGRRGRARGGRGRHQAVGEALGEGPVEVGAAQAAEEPLGQLGLVLALCGCVVVGGGGGDWASCRVWCRVLLTGWLVGSSCCRDPSRPSIHPSIHSIHPSIHAHSHTHIPARAPRSPRRRSWSSRGRGPGRSWPWRRSRCRCPPTPCQPWNAIGRVG